MNKKLAVVLLSALLLCSCARVKSDVSADSSQTTDITSESAVESKAPESETTAESETETTYTTPPTDGKTHVSAISLDKYSLKLSAGESDMPMVSMSPAGAENKNEIWSSSDNTVAMVNVYGKITAVGEGSCTVTVASADNPGVKAEVNVSVTGKSSIKFINGILIANKSYGLPSSFDPGVNAEAKTALDNMIAAAAREGINLNIKSAYRSYATQNTLYNNYAARDGYAEADRYSARPGYSEHQTGLSFDLNSLEQSFGQTKEGKWLEANCWKFGFIIRYPADKEAVTGYMYEPWHVRYLDTETATKVYNSGLCLEEYLNITSVYAN